MGIQINGQTDTISAIDGALTVSGADLPTVTNLNATGIVTATGFVGNITGNINATGVSTIATLNVTQSNPTRLNVTGVSTFTTGPVLIGSGTSTGTASQTLQVTGGAYVSGSIGVGVANPDSLLHLKSTTGNVRHTIEVPDTFQAFTNYSAANSEFSIGYIRNSGADHSFRFCAADGLSSGEIMRIDSVNSRIGIGTASPSQKLEVVGGEIKAGRVDSNEEGGQVSFGRATDNATGWYIDVYGNTSTPSLRFVDVSNSAVRLQIDGSGRPSMNGAVFYATGGNASINSTFSIDVTVRDDSGSGNGGAYKVFAGITHFNFTSYGAVYEAWVACRGTSVNESLTQNNTTSGQGGSWSVSKPTGTTLRVTHNGGSLSAPGNYFVFVLAAS